MQSKQKKFDDRNHEGLYSTEHFDFDEGISPLIRFRNPISEKTASCDDQSGMESESTTPPTVASQGSTPRPRVRFFIKKEIIALS